MTMSSEEEGSGRDGTCGSCSDFDDNAKSKFEESGDDLAKEGSNGGEDTEVGDDGDGQGEEQTPSESGGH